MVPPEVDSSEPKESLPRWRIRLNKELQFRPEFEKLDEHGWRTLFKKRRVTSSNHDTVLALDWPHYCANATVACGGPRGWCYTFQGNQANQVHNRHVAMVDVFARKFPALFGETVAAEVNTAVKAGLLPTANLRYSGSGEVVEAYLPALQQVQLRDIHLWGFTRNLRLARALRDLGAGVIFSCDSTTPTGIVTDAQNAAFPLAYTSNGVDDLPPTGTIVTFPVHRVGRVREVADTSSICPKVLADYLDDTRPPGSCQHHCRRCHEPRLP